MCTALIGVRFSYCFFLLLFLSVLYRCWCWCLLPPPEWHEFHRSCCVTGSRAAGGSGAVRVSASFLFRVAARFYGRVGAETAAVAAGGSSASIGLRCRWRVTLALNQLTTRSTMTENAEDNTNRAMTCCSSTDMPFTNHNIFLFPHNSSYSSCYYQWKQIVPSSPKYDHPWPVRFHFSDNIIIINKYLKMESLVYVGVCLSVRPVHWKVESAPWEVKFEKIFEKCSIMNHQWPPFRPFRLRARKPDWTRDKVGEKLGQCDRRQISANFPYPKGSISFDYFDFQRIRR